MRQIIPITATEARNQFFKIIKKSFLEKKKYVVLKGDIPLVYISPIEEETTANQLKTLTELKIFRKKMRKTSDSVKLLRKIRDEGRY